jgi:integrase
MVSRPLVSSKITMATSKVRRRANGSIRYTAIVRVRKGTTVVHRESRTFTPRSAAQSWARHREVALEDPVELTRHKQSTPTLAELIRWYIDTFEKISRWQRSKQTHLETLERHALGKVLAHPLTSADLIRHVQSRRAAGAGPATVINALILVGVVLRAARSVREISVSPEVVERAKAACSDLRLIGKPKRRTRRPTEDELARLRQHFKGRDRRAEIPMEAVMDFAIASARREAEICRLEWRDNDKATRTGMVTSNSGNRVR